MKTKTINIYEYKELSDKAKEKAFNNFLENNYLDFLENDLIEHIKALLEEKNIISFQGIKLNYDLSYYEGYPFLYFSGYFDYKGLRFNVNIDNYYNTSSIELEEEEINDELKEDVIKVIEEEFKEIYNKICSNVKDNGLRIVEHENSEENFNELCDINEYYFNEFGGLE